jgi:hypothetical protein
MKNSVYKLLIEIIGKDKGASQELKQTRQEVDALGKSSSKMNTLMAGAGALGIAYMGKQAVSAAWDLGKLGAAAIVQSDALDELARQAGGSADAIVAAMKKASGGTVAETDIILAANRGILLGLGAQAEQWEKLTEVARFRARAMGITTTQAVNDITTAIGRESKMIADNLGIVWNMDAIMGDYAKTLGKTASELTQAERKQALLNDTIRTGQKQIQEAGGILGNAADEFAELETKLADLKAGLAKAWAPILVTIILKVEEAVGTGEQIWMMAEAADDAAAAWVHGKDAGDAFNKSMKEQLGIVEEVTVAGHNWYQELLLLPEPLEQLAGTSALATNAVNIFSLALAQSGDTAQDFAEDILGISLAMHELRLDAANVSGDELVSGYESVTGRIETQLANLAGDVSFTALQEIRRRYVGEIDALFQEIADAYAEGTAMTDFELEYRLNLITARFDEEVDVLENAGVEVGRAASNVSSAYEDLRSAVESALTPTSVTAWDMELSALGQYVDKWDENARRLDAVAEAGFGAFDAHPDWIEILKIPDDVLAGGEAGLKAWAAQTAASVRDLTRPDLLNIDAAVAAVEQYFVDMAARELSIDLVTEALIAKGVVSGPDAKKQVAQALGLDQTVVGEEAGSDIFQGMIDKFSEKSAATEFAGYLKTDVVAQAGALRGAGYELWITTEVGILAAMEEGNYVTRWVELLLPALLAAMGEAGTWSGGGEP